MTDRASRHHPDEHREATSNTVNRALMIAGMPRDELLSRLRAGEAEALALLHSELYPSLWRFAVHLLRSTAVADEIIQDVFLALWRRHETITLHDDIRAYLFAAVRNRIRDHYRHEQVILVSEATISNDALGIALMGEPTPTPDSVTERQAFIDAYRRAVATLSEREAMVLFLRWEEELTLDQVSQALGVSVEGVRKIVLRAQKKLQELLDAYRS